MVGTGIFTMQIQWVTLSQTLGLQALAWSSLFMVADAGGMDRRRAKESPYESRGPNPTQTSAHEPCTMPDEREATVRRDSDDGLDLWTTGSSARRLNLRYRAEGSRAVPP